MTQKFYGLTVEQRAAIEELLLGLDPRLSDEYRLSRTRHLEAVIAGIDPTADVDMYRQDLNDHFFNPRTHMVLYYNEGLWKSGKPCFVLKNEHEFPPSRRENGSGWIFAGVISRDLGCGMLVHPATQNQLQLGNLVELVHKALRCSGDMVTTAREAIQARRFNLYHYRGAAVELRRLELRFEN